MHIILDLHNHARWLERPLTNSPCHSVEPIIGITIALAIPEQTLNRLIAMLDTRELAAALERAERPDALDESPGG